MQANILPEYYNGWEVGKFISQMDLDFFLGNAIKYLCRWRKKNGLEDLRKLNEYLIHADFVAYMGRFSGYKSRTAMSVDLMGVVVRFVQMFEFDDDELAIFLDILAYAFERCDESRLSAIEGVDRLIDKTKELSDKTIAAKGAK